MNSCRVRSSSSGSNYSRMVRLLLVVFVVLASRASAGADVLLSAGSFSNLGSNSGTSTATSGSVARAAGGTSGNISSSARSYATFGILKTYASASAAVSNGNSTYGINQTFFQDDFLFNAPGKTGTQGTVEMKFTVFGSLQASRSANTSDWLFGVDENANARVSYQLTTDGGFSSGQVNQGLYGRGDTEGTPFLGVEQVYSVPFVFGTTLTNVKLRVSNQAQAMGYSSNDFSSTSLSDQEHTTNWGGFGAVRDASGNLVTDYTFSSASGFNYVNAVPEPGCLGVVASFVGALASFRRRRTGDFLSQARG